MAITLRGSKGSTLTHAELDGNFSQLSVDVGLVAGRVTALENAPAVTVPTALSQLANDVGFITSETDSQTLTVNGNDLTISNGNTVTLPIPTVPTQVSQLANDSGYISSETLTTLSLGANQLTYVDEAGNTTNLDLSVYLDDTNAARITSGTVDNQTGIATFTRDDATTFTVDFSTFISSVSGISDLTDVSFNGVPLDGTQGQGKILAWEQTLQAFVPVNNTLVETDTLGTVTGRGAVASATIDMNGNDITNIGWLQSTANADLNIKAADASVPGADGRNIIMNAGTPASGGSGGLILIGPLANTTSIEIGGGPGYAGGRPTNMHGTLDVAGLISSDTGLRTTGADGVYSTFSIETGANFTLEGTAFSTSITKVDPTQNRTITLPDNDGTVALLSDISSTVQGNEAYHNFAPNTTSVNFANAAVATGSYLQTDEPTPVDIEASVSVTNGFSKTKIELSAAVTNVTDPTTEIQIDLVRQINSANETVLKTLIFPVSQTFYGSQAFMHIDTHGANQGDVVTYKLKVNMSGYSNESARLVTGISGDTLYIKEIA